MILFFLFIILYTISQSSSSCNVSISMASPITSIPTITSISGTPAVLSQQLPLEPMILSLEMSPTIGRRNLTLKASSKDGEQPSSPVLETPLRQSIQLRVPPQRLLEKSMPSSQMVKMTHESMDQIRQSLQHYKTSLYYNVIYSLEHPSSPQSSSASSVLTSSTSSTFTD